MGTTLSDMWIKYNTYFSTKLLLNYYSDLIMGAMASPITSLTIVYSIVYSCADQRKHQISASLAFVRGIHRWPANCPHKGPVTRKTFPFDDVIMILFANLHTVVRASMRNSVESTKALGGVCLDKGIPVQKDLTKKDAHSNWGHILILCGAFV